MARVFAVCLVLIVGCLVAVLPASAQAKTPPLVHHWNEELHEMEALLAAGKWQAAERDARRVEDQLAEYIVAGGEELLGRVASLRAVALAGLGDIDLARWLWRTGEQLFPGVANLDLSAYGEAGARLRPVEGQETRRCDEDSLANEPPVGTVEGETRPQLIKRVDPELPLARVGLSHPVQIVVSAVIGTDGIPREPCVVESGREYTTLYRTLEALGRWRFAPATRSGVAVSAPFTFNVTYVTAGR